MSARRRTDYRSVPRGLAKGPMQRITSPTSIDHIAIAITVASAAPLVALTTSGSV